MPRAATRSWAHPAVRFLWIAVLLVASAVPSFAAPSAVSPYESLNHTNALATPDEASLEKRSTSLGRTEEEKEAAKEKERIYFLLAGFEDTSLLLIPDPTMGPGYPDAKVYGKVWKKKGSKEYQAPDSDEDCDGRSGTRLILEDSKVLAGPVETFDIDYMFKESPHDPERKGYALARRASSKQIPDPAGILRLVQGFRAQETLGRPYAMPGFAFLAKKEAGVFKKSKNIDAVVVSLPGGMSEVKGRTGQTQLQQISERTQLHRFASLIKAVQELRDKKMFHLNLHPGNVFFDQGKDQGKDHGSGDDEVDGEKVFLTGFEYVTKALTVKNATGSTGFAAPESVKLARSLLHPKEHPPGSVKDNDPEKLTVFSLGMILFFHVLSNSAEGLWRRLVTASLERKEELSSADSKKEVLGFLDTAIPPSVDDLIRVRIGLLLGGLLCAPQYRLTIDELALHFGDLTEAYDARKNEVDRDYSRSLVYYFENSPPAYENPPLPLYNITTICEDELLETGNPGRTEEDIHARLEASSSLHTSTTSATAR